MSRPECTVLLGKYAVMISLVSIFFLVELIVGILANSITLQTDAFHMLSDLLALIIGLIALLVLDRKHHRYTFGWVRAEIIAGLVNGVFLLSIGFMLIIENIEKFIELANNTENEKLEENIDLVLYVAVAGLVINIAGIIMFCGEQSHTHSHSHAETGETEETIVKNYAQAAVFLHIVGDTLGSILVICTSIVIKFVDSTWKFYLDPAGSLLIVGFIAISSGKLLHQCIKILMHHWSGHPAGDIQEDLASIDGIDGIHEFHVWSLNSKVAVASMHIRMQADITSEDLDQILTEIKDKLHKKGIHSSTIQPEWEEECIEPVCLTDCSEKKCCKPPELDCSSEYE